MPDSEFFVFSPLIFCLREVKLSFIGKNRKVTELSSLTIISEKKSDLRNIKFENQNQK